VSAPAFPHGRYVQIAVQKEKGDIGAALALAEELTKGAGPEQHASSGGGAAVGYLPVDPRLAFSGVYPNIGEEISRLAAFHGSDAKAVIRDFGLENLLSRRSSELSGGQVAIASVALTAAARPRAWVLDRCFEWVDVGHKAMLASFFKRELQSGRPVIELSAGRSWLLREEMESLPTAACVKGVSQGSVLDVVDLVVTRGDFSIGPTTFSVGPGECIVLRGGNGSGKTTLAKALVNLIPYRGTIRLGKRNVRGPRSVLSFQNPDDQLYRSTVRAEIADPARRLPVDGTRLCRVSEMLHLERLMQEDPLGLPLADRRLVSIAAALVADVPLVILDEPTSYLNAGQVASVRRAAQYVANGGTAVMAITHDDGFAASFAQRCLEIDAGRLTELSAFASRPAS
jgi:energy-coupling factor transporter ATP-binding protein EcfA2